MQPASKDLSPPVPAPPPEGAEGRSEAPQDAAPCSAQHAYSAWSSSMAHFLAGHNHETREKLLELFREEIFRPRYNLSLPEERELAFRRLKRVCELGVVSVRDFLTNPRNIFATHEICGLCDGSLSTKLTVQFNLFGGTVLKLGTQKHHDLLLEGIDRLERVGCFALTELGYGNNAVEMETTATYDKAADEFVIHTPTPKAQKYWITNGAVHAHYSVVFARLIMPGGQDEGLHGFLVPIRSLGELQEMPGVRVWDMGYKIGLNGVDNAALWFDKVRVPRDALLDRTSRVAPGGAFSSSVADDSARKRKRFLKLADQLLSGRVCIASMSIGCTQLVLASTVRFSCSRLGVGPDGHSSCPIMDYQLQRNTIMPLVATTYALKIGLNHVQAKYAQLSLQSSDAEHEELVRLCCIIKPLVTWHAENTATTCRERCGGQGFLAANRFGEAIVGAHAGITAEGDNRVMQLKVATELLRHCIDRGAVRAHGLRTRLLPRGWGAGVSGDPADLAWQRRVFKARYEFCLNELAMRMHEAKQRKEPLFDSVMAHQSDLIQALATAYGEKMVADACGAAIADPATPSELKPILRQLISLWGLCRLRADAELLLTEGLISPRQCAAAADHQRQLSWELGAKARELVDGFGVPEHMHHEPIANDWVQYNNGENPAGELDNQAYRRVYCSL